VGLNDNGGNLFGFGEGIIGLGDLFTGLPESAALDFFRPKERRFRRGLSLSFSWSLSSSDGRLNKGGYHQLYHRIIEREDELHQIDAFSWDTGNRNLHSSLRTTILDFLSSGPRQALDVP